jgi:excisionase family DNA binding protein
VPIAPINRQPSLRPDDESTASLLTIEQAAERINMSVRYVRRLVAERRIAFHKLGRSVRIATADLDELVAGGRFEPLHVADDSRVRRAA